MVKKVSNHHLVSYLREKKTFGERLSDKVTNFAGSWVFITFFGIFLLIWILLNIYVLMEKPFDPYPFILLNLALSCLAAVQAPIILMSQNRQTQRDRIKAEKDFYINRKAEREVQDMQKDLDEIKSLIKKRKH